MLLHEIFGTRPEIYEAIVSGAGKGHEFRTLSQMMACSKELHGNGAVALMYAQCKNEFHEFLSTAKIACEAIASQQSLTLCFDQMMKYKEEPFFLYAMKAMMYTAASRYGDDCIDARQQMRRARALLENFDWHNFCAQLELYQGFQFIVDVFIDCILDVVIDKHGIYRRRMCTYDGVEAPFDGVTRQEYCDQKRRILGNMGDAGVVACIWQVCRSHSRFLNTQQKLMDILCEMSESRSVCCVRNILRIPGHMHMLYDISSLMASGVSSGGNILKIPAQMHHPSDISSVMASGFSYDTVCNRRNYIWLIRVMFDSDPVFTAHEEIKVVAVVHRIIAEGLYVGTKRGELIPLLNVVADRVRTSTLRELTEAQIHVLCNSDVIQDEPAAVQLVSSLLHRALAAKGIFDTSKIPRLFALPDRDI